MKLKAYETANIRRALRVTLVSDDIAIQSKAVR
jgi:hypothetical protein